VAGGNAAEASFVDLQLALPAYGTDDGTAAEAR